MMKKLFCFTMAMFLMAGVSFAGTVNLPQTGQKKCYDTSGNEITCTSTVQDGEIQAGVTWPTPRFTANTDTTIKDNLTGLIWAPNGNIMPTRDPGWDTDYTANDGRVKWQHALDYVAKLNSENYLNHTDWRLPTVNELESLVNANEANTATWLNTQGFTNVQANAYWSSTTYPEYPISAWYVDMDNGYVHDNGKSGYIYVWPVRAENELNASAQVWETGQTKCYDASGTEISCTGTGQDRETRPGIAWPSPRFTDHGNGTVTDNLTGLMWTKRC